jgi:hypothetical protein
VIGNLEERFQQAVQSFWDARERHVTDRSSVIHIVIGDVIQSMIGHVIQPMIGRPDPVRDRMV